MTYSSLMVHIDLGIANAAILRVTADLAERFRARVIGVAAYSPLLIIYSDGYESGQLMKQDRAVMDRHIRDGAAEFHAALAGRVTELEWRVECGCGAPSIAIAAAARAADLVVVAPKPQNPLFTPSRRVEIGDLVMRAGRPVLVVPNFVTELRLKHVVVGWQDTREARRAVADSLPLLERADKVTLVEVAEAASAARANTGDVARWLESHGVDAVCETVTAANGDETGLRGFAAEIQADVLVAGAWGHDRLQEWVFGGVTRDLLLQPPCCALLSH